MSGNSNRWGGECRCGARAFKYDPAAVRFVHHCHCADCRRTTGAAFSTWVGIANTGFRWQGPGPSLYRSSPGVRWGFCPDCGTRLTYDAEADEGETHFLIGLFTDSRPFRPTLHAFWPERLPWLRLNDGLPKHIGESDTPLVDERRAAE